MPKKKIRLRPWVKVTMLFVLGIVAVSQVFSIFDAMASDEGEPKTRMVHGVIQLNINGESELSILEDDYVGDIRVKQKKGYDHFEIVTVVVKGNRVVNDYITTGEELKEVEKEYEWTIVDIRTKIMQSLYE